MEYGTLSGKNALVTGGIGFVGSHLVHRLSELGANVAVLDDFSAGRASNLRGIKAKIVRGDVSRRSSWKLKKVDYLFHLAANQLSRSFRNPIRDLSINAAGTLLAMEFARRHDARVIYASTASVYGDADRFPIQESAPLRPVSPYAVSKLAGEMYVRNAVHEYGVHATSLRFFNIYGPRQVVSRKVGVVPIFITKALRNKVITIDGSGEQTRDFTYVADAVEAAIRAGTVKDAKSTTLNIGSGKECAVVDLARMIIRICKSSSKLVYGPPKLGDISRLLADTRAARKTIGYSPKVGLEEGIIKCIAGLRDER